MQAVRSVDTAPEIAIRRELWRMGVRYRVNVRPLAGLNRSADIVFRNAKVAVFVDGCFWHGCPEHGRRAHEVNNWYWPDKIRRNVERDLDTNRRLADEGWAVVRVWEHDDFMVVADFVRRLVKARRGDMQNKGAAQTRNGP